MDSNCRRPSQWQGDNLGKKTRVCLHGRMLLLLRIFFDVYYCFIKQVKTCHLVFFACQRWQRRSGSLQKPLTWSNAFSFSTERVHAVALGEMTSFEEALQTSLLVIQPAFFLFFFYLIHFNTAAMLLKEDVSNELWHHSDYTSPVLLIMNQKQFNPV